MCDGTEILMVEQSLKDAEKLNVASMMTEFGASSDSPIQLEEISMLMNIADEKAQSYSYWQVLLRMRFPISLVS